jgi:hypothetical protein
MESRVVNLDDYDNSCTDDAIITLQMLVSMFEDSHKIWRITPNATGGAWDYAKVEDP